MIRSIPIVALAILCPFFLFTQNESMGKDTALAGQNLWYAYNLGKKDAKVDSAIYIAQKSVETYKKYLGEQCIEVAKAYHILAILCAGKGVPEQSIYFDLKALDITVKTIGYNTVQVSNILLNLGVWYRNFDQQKSIRYSEECLDIRKKIYGGIHSEVATTYNNIALNYWEIGDYNKAIDYNLKALSILEQLPDKDSLTIASAYVGLGNIYGNLKQYEKVNLYYEKALAIRLKKLGLLNQNVARTYSNLGQWCLEEKRYDDAFSYSNKALHIRQQILSPDHADIATSYNNLGLVFDATGLVDSAILCLQKAVEIREKKLGSNHPRLGTAYFNLAEFYNHKGDSDEAIINYKKAFAILLANINTTGPDCINALNALVQALLKEKRNQELKELFENLELVKSPVLYPVSMQGKIQLLQIKGRYFTSFSGASENSTDENLAPFEEMDQLLSSDQYRSWTTDLREQFLSDISQGYFSGASACIDASEKTGNPEYLDRAFKYSEKSKAFILYGKLKEEEAKFKAGVPDSLLQMERNLYTKMDYYERKIFDAKSRDAAFNDSLVIAWSGKLFDSKAAISEFKKTLEIQYPRYYKLKYNLNTVSVAYLQDSLLQQDQALIEYFTGDSTIEVFLILPDTFSVFTIRKNFPLETWVTNLHKSISEYGIVKTESDMAANKAVGDYIEMADSLYQKLLAPFVSRLPESLIIVPDDILGYIPFEALLEKRPLNRFYFKNYAFFGNKHNVSYCYSSTLLREMRTKIHVTRPKLEFIGFAPYYTGDTSTLAKIYGDDYSVRKDLQPLPNSGKELFAIHKMMKGRVYYGPDATKSRFLEDAGKARVIHLATHARADSRVGDYAWLAFSEIKDSVENELLYIRDIYNLTLNADLVVLSACETGYGKLQHGEGIISMARAFAYAGAKSIVTTLWSVSDAQTSEIMIAFYANLKKGVPSVEALWKAKKDYVQGKNDDRAHPYYWAGLIGIGL